MGVKRSRIRFTLILTTLFLIAVPATASAAGSEGDLTQKPGTAACISETGSSGVCADGVGLSNPRLVTVSPDGKSAYVASSNSDAVAVFDRNTTTGALTQKSGTDACISETGSSGVCADGVGLDSARSVTVSPDGKSAYVASFVSDAVAVFDREDSNPPDKPSFDSTIPASPANNNMPSVKGTAETGSTVGLYTTNDCTGAAAATGPAANFAAPGLGVIVPDDSTNTFYATATDGAGNTSACSTESIAYTDDKTPPETTIDTGPTGTTTNPSPSFGFSSSESGSTFQCSLDSGAFATCSSPKAYASLSDGSHTFRVRATDVAGNTDSTPATRTFTVDTTVYRAKIGKVKVSGPGKVKKGKKATYKVKIKNSGNAKAKGVRLKVKGRGVSFNTSVGKIVAKKTKTVKVKLKAKKPGKVKVTFKVTSKNAGGKSVKKKIKVKK
jgi:DNA-binding beta-propeller fold protein YncE